MLTATKPIDEITIKTARTVEAGTKITVGIVGQVSSGKSSLVNALLGNMCSPVALERSTMRPIHYTNTAHGVHGAHGTAPTDKEESSLLDSARNHCLTQKQQGLLRVPIQRFSTLPYDIIDFAGIADDTNLSGDDTLFLKIFMDNLNKLDIIVFVSNCEHIFVLGPEWKVFLQIHTAVRANVARGRHQQLIVVANKYDYEDDEIDQVIASAEAKLKSAKVHVNIYPVSAWGMYVAKKVNTPVPIASWQERECKKMKRVANHVLTTAEKRLVDILHDDVRFIQAYEHILHEYVHRAFNSGGPIYDTIENISDLVRRVRQSDEQKYIDLLATWSKSCTIGCESQLIIIYSVMHSFSYDLYDCLSVLRPCIFTCISDANECLIGDKLQPFIGKPWMMEGTVIFDNRLSFILAQLKLALSVDSKDLAWEIVKCIPAQAKGPKPLIIDDTFIIALIPNKSVREFLALRSSTYEEIIAKLIANGTQLGRIVGEYIVATKNNFSYQEFKTIITTDYFVHGKRGKIYEVINNIIANH
jgi:hypothetical protein